MILRFFKGINHLDDYFDDQLCFYLLFMAQNHSNLWQSPLEILQYHSAIFRGSFPIESSQWKICAIVIEDIEDIILNEEIIKRNLMTLALCGLVITVIIIIVVVLFALS